MTGVQCVVFDIDDTLYLERDYVRSGFHAVGEHLQRTHGVDGFSRRAWELFESGHRGSTFDVVLAELGLPEALVPGLVRVYREHEPDIELLPDAREALGTLSRYVHLAVISDGPEQSQREKAKALGLERWCDPIVLTARYGREFGKPHPRAFEEVEGSVRLAGASCAYIADNPSKDFIAPKALGWRCLRVRRPGGLHHAVDGCGGADLVVDRLDLRFFEEWLGLLTS